MNRFHTLAVARATLPRLTIAQRVIDRIVAHAPKYETETGESLIGLAVDVPGRAEPDIYVLDTIMPYDDVVRQSIKFEQGDDWQGDIFNWYNDNWNDIRKKRQNSYGNALGAKWDTALVHLGNWHKHPEGFVEPSGGDYDTAVRDLSDEHAGIPQWVVMLATLWQPNQSADPTPSELVGFTSDSPSPILKITTPTGLIVRIDFWYISRRNRRFVRLAPIIGDDKLMPTMPPLAWHLAHPDRMKREADLLFAEGYSCEVKQHDADNVPPREISIVVYKRTSKHLLIIVTQADFPETPPTVRWLPMKRLKEVPEDVKYPFLWLFEHSAPVPPHMMPAWNADTTILSLVHTLEPRLAELQAPEQVSEKVSEQVSQQVSQNTSEQKTP
jgi:hypothetical protein